MELFFFMPWPSVAVDWGGPSVAMWPGLEEKFLVGRSTVVEETDG